jgi:hypothetical protein
LVILKISWRTVWIQEVRTGVRASPPLERELTIGGLD